MKRSGLALMLTIWFMTAVAQAPADSQLTPINPWQQWTFTGTTTNEKGDVYYYYFDFQQHGFNRSAEAVLLDEKSNILMQYHKVSSKSSSVHFHPNQWKLGRAFFRYYPITRSWVFGLHRQKDEGFNFKGDIRNHEGDMGERQSISADLNLEMNQFHQLNGHIYLPQEPKEQFVTAKRGWLRYLEGSQVPSNLSTLLCNQADGAGLHSSQYDSEKAKKGAISGWRDKDGKRHRVSQFIKIAHKSTGLWQISLPGDKKSWQLNQLTILTDPPFQTDILVSPKDKSGMVCFYQTALTNSVR